MPIPAIVLFAAATSRVLPPVVDGLFTRVVHPQMGAKRKQGSSRRAAPRKISPKGFGAKPKGSGKLLSEPEYETMCEWLCTSSMTSLHKVGVADFDGLRGVMALQDIAVGEEIVAIPAQFAVDLGSQNRDPLPAARRLLHERKSVGGDSRAYWDLLPPPDSRDLCTADFMSERELELLQWPPLVLETRERAKQLEKVLTDASPGELSDELLEFKYAGARISARIPTACFPRMFLSIAWMVLQVGSLDRAQPGAYCVGTRWSRSQAADSVFGYVQSQS